MHIVLDPAVSQGLGDTEITTAENVASALSNFAGEAQAHIYFPRNHPQLGGQFESGNLIAVTVRDRELVLDMANVTRYKFDAQSLGFSNPDVVENLGNKSYTVPINAGTSVKFGHERKSVEIESTGSDRIIIG